MEAAAPEAAEPQATAEPQAEPRQRSWRRVKVPTSVVVTLVGIALTAWLLPAFTRQWDDRQKARELKAGLASDMGKSTATVLYQASASSGAPRNVVAQSLVSQADIASRLRLSSLPVL
jgi:hypothetical protein